MSVPAEPKGSILTPAGWMRGRVRIKDRRIAGIDGDLLRPDMTPESPFIVPGFIDLHVHGGLGGECMSGEAGVRQTLKYHAAHGTVALAPTTVTAPVPLIEAVLADIAATQAKPRSGEAAVLGAGTRRAVHKSRSSGRSAAFRAARRCVAGVEVG